MLGPVESPCLLMPCKPNRPCPAARNANSCLRIEENRNETQRVGIPANDLEPIRDPDHGHEQVDEAEARSTQAVRAQELRTSERLDCDDCEQGNKSAYCVRRPTGRREGPRRWLPLTRVGGSLQFGSSLPEVANRKEVRGTMADEPRESLEAVRLEKLERIAALGPTRGGSDSTATRRSPVRALAVPCRLETSATTSLARWCGLPGGSCFGAGRARSSSSTSATGPTESRSSSARSKLATGWTLVDQLDLGDLIGVDGRLGHTKTGELTVFAETTDISGQELASPARKVARSHRPEQRYRQR